MNIYLYEQTCDVCQNKEDCSTCKANKKKGHKPLREDQIEYLEAKRKDNI